MSQGKSAINSHIETYLDYYCGLSHAPGFAVLLKGQWGCGKTWFINKYIEKLKIENHKCLYVSLYGMTSFSDIEDAWFQQLHPDLSSKKMAIGGKIVKASMKALLKIDLNDIKLPEYLVNTEGSILIFDDIERCKIDIGNILGYINYFVEHQDLKVIIIANEDELLKVDSYSSIKEKLIGKTFDVTLDFDNALKSFIELIDRSEAKDFLLENIELIKSTYNKADYNNLRSLKQIVLDFERIFNILIPKAKNKPELLQEILTTLMAFSIEIKRGVLSPKNIGNLCSIEHISRYTSRTLGDSEESQDKEESITLRKKLIDRYPFLPIYELFPSERWWENFLDKGIIDEIELEQSTVNSKYFQTENTPDWVKLWHFNHLSDDEFEPLLRKVESGYNNRDYVEAEIVKHIFGIFLALSGAGLYSKSKKDILEDSKAYIDYLKKNDKIDFISSSFFNYSVIETNSDAYAGLGFRGTNFQEFKEFLSYIGETRELVRQENLPTAGKDLLATMKDNSWRFYGMVCPDSSQRVEDLGREYYTIPIFTYTDPNIFVENILSIDFDDRNCVFWALHGRYENDHYNEKLISELGWLKSVRHLLNQEIQNRKGKLSGFSLNELITRYLNTAIENLEAKEKQMQCPPVSNS